jgi:threonyl-tRNA synthetase
LASIEKELQQAKKDNASLARYINTRRKKEEARRKEEARKKTEEEDHRKVMVVAPTFDESQSSKDVRTWRK